MAALVESLPGAVVRASRLSTDIWMVALCVPIGVGGHCRYSERRRVSLSGSAKALQARGIRTPRGKTNWHARQVARPTERPGHSGAQMVECFRALLHAKTTG